MTYNITPDYSRDALFPPVSLTRMKDSYMNKGDISPQDVFVRAASKYASDKAHAQRLYDYVSKHWFMFSTPIMANSASKRGQGISCFLNAVEDSLESIADHYKETIFLTAAGGGVGGFWNLRTSGKRSKSNGQNPWLKVTDDLMLAGNQGDTRRGSYAAYTDVSHPEIMEFMQIRDTRGDHTRRALGTGFHHGVCLTDDFMQAVVDNKDWNLVDPHTKAVVETLPARIVFNKLLKCRLETGEPYLFFTDNANRALPKHLRDKGLRISHSNLCNEIYLPTGRDYNNKMRTAICCLSSVNMAKFDEWEHCAEQMIADLIEMLDNVLQAFIETASPELHQAVYSASMTRDLGLGQMGFHTYLQSKGIAFESEEAREVNKRLSYIWSAAAKKASRELGVKRGFYPDSTGNNGYQHKARNAHVLAIAPNASSGIICGNVSPSIEPWSANVIKNVTISGITFFKNPILEALLQERGHNTDAVWNSIVEADGSVQHLDCLYKDEKLVFKTFGEINPAWIITHAADRQPFIDQGQSLNIKPDPEYVAENPWEFAKWHIDAWRLGLKGMYYCRSKGKKNKNLLTQAATRQTIEIVAPPTEDTGCAACEG